MEALSPFWVALANYSGFGAGLFKACTVVTAGAFVVLWAILVFSRDDYHYSGRGFRMMVVERLSITWALLLMFIMAHVWALVSLVLIASWLLTSFALSMWYDKWTPAWGLFETYDSVSE